MTDEKRLKVYNEANVLSDLLLQRVINDDIGIADAMCICTKLPIFLLAKTLDKKDFSDYMGDNYDLAAEIVNGAIDKFSENENMSVPELYCLISAIADYMTNSIVS